MQSNQIQNPYYLNLKAYKMEAGCFHKSTCPKIVSQQKSQSLKKQTYDPTATNY